MKAYKKFMIIAIALLAAILLATLCACDPKAQTPEGTTPPELGEGGEKEPQYPPTESETDITLEELISDHLAKAKAFVQNDIEPLAFAEKDILGKQCYLVGDKDISEANILYIYAGSNTSRVIEFADITLNEPVDIDDIVDGSYPILTSSDVTISTKALMTFNAKQNQDDQELCEALYDAAGFSAEKIKLLASAAPDRPGYKYFNLYSMDDKTVNIYKIGVLEGDGSNATLLNNIEQSKVTAPTKKATEMKGSRIYGEDYDLSDEKFENDPVVDPSDPENPTNPEDPDQPSNVTDAELIAALQTYCAYGIIGKAFNGREFDSQDITPGSWYVSQDANENITSVRFSFTFNQTETNSFFFLGSMTFNNPISKQNLKNGNIEGATYKTDYTLVYDPSIQADYAELTDAIFEALGVEDTGAERIIINQGGGVEQTLGEIQYYKVVEISDNAINEYSIKVKRSGSSIMDNLKNNQFEELTSERKTTQIEGRMLVA